MKQVNIDALTIYGVSLSTNNQTETSAEAKISGLWAEFFNTYPAVNATLYGVYSDYTAQADGEYRVTVGSQTPQAAAAKVTIQAGTYLAWTVSGPMPQAMAEAWAAVWTHFSQVQPYTRTFKTDVEVYDGPHSATLYIGIQMR